MREEGNIITSVFYPEDRADNKRKVNPPPSYLTSQHVKEEMKKEGGKLRFCMFVGPFLRNKLS